MNTTENNKLIAEFMGGLYNNQSRLSLQSNEIWLPYHGVCNYKSNNGKCLQYHSSWDWLIPVVEKIKSIPNKEKFGMLKYEVDVILDVPNAQIVQGYKRMLGDKSNEYFDVVCYENDFITNAYNACISFIEWYNEQNK